MTTSDIKKIAFYFRPAGQKATAWEEKLGRWIHRRFPKVAILASNRIPKSRKDAPDLLIILGGDGTILEAVQRFQRWNPLILGLNLGHVGFLASVREPKQFTRGITKVFQKKHHAIPHMLMKATLVRHDKKIYSAYALNDIAVQNLSGLVDIRVAIAEHTVQYIHGSGVLVSTATGSTAYNLSAHGPIVMPDIKCFIITELFDHGIPTPSVVVKRDRTITIKIGDFRKRGQFAIEKTGETADTVLFAGPEEVIALQKGDTIRIEKSRRLIKFAEIEKNYFFKSLQEKFMFR